MFEAAELGHRISKEEYAREEPLLREALLNAQYALIAKPKFPVIVIIGGVDGAGKGETVNLLNEWMDPRHIITRAFGDASDEEAERPPMWRFWRALPAKGRIGILFGSWYTGPIVDRVMRRTGDKAFLTTIEEVRHFERMLVAEGALILKFWFHLSREAQEKRLADLEADKRTRWRVTAQDRSHFKSYGRFRKISETMLRETSTGEAPWIIVEGADPRYRALTTGRTLLDALKGRLAGEQPPLPAPAPLEPPIDARNVINTLDYSLSLTSKEYRAELEKLQGRLALLTRKPGFAQRSVIMVFEGQDAAGKGSTIRRITGALDARHYSVIPIAAPTEEERAQPYLWRFWRHIPRLGRVTIFDRSWYGRVLVERIEKFAAEADWMRAYHEINRFEEEQAEHGAIVLKFWLAITKEEQLKRFRLRQKTSFKSFKITDEDWRNRKKWALYERAVCDLVERTSTAHAPWHLIPANDKLYARLTVLRTLCEALEKAL